MTIERFPSGSTTTGHSDLARFGFANVQTGFVWLLAIVAGLALYFQDGIFSLIEAWKKDEYSHGWLIPFVAGFLILRELRNEQGPVERGSEIPGLLIILAGLVVGLLGNITQIPYFITYGLIISAGGLILTIAGAKRGLKFWAAWAYLLFMLPLPTAAYWQVSGQLQFLSSKIGVEVIRLLDVPVLLEGNVIDLGIYKLQVAEACSGLRYLFPLASFGFLFAVLYRGPFWHKAILFLSSFPITVLMNSFRIGIIGVLVNSYGIEQADGFLHWFEGWIIFIACMVILLAEAWLLQRFVAEPKSMLGMLDIDSTGVAAPLKNILLISSSKVIAALGIISLAAGLTWTVLPKPTSIVPDHKPFAVFPTEFNGWSGQERRNSADVERVLGADDYVAIEYVSPTGKESVDFFSAFYNSTTDGTGIHSPETCIPGGGWEVSKWDRYSVPVKSINGDNLQVNRAIIQKGGEKRLVYYWFEMRGNSYASEYQAKFYTVWHSMTRRRADGALVRFITKIQQGETEADGDRRLAKFIPGVLGVLPEYVPN